MSQEDAFKELTVVTVLLWELVDKQSKDQKLWFGARIESEAYLQQELRKLHDVIERQAIAFGEAMQK